MHTGHRMRRGHILNIHVPHQKIVRQKRWHL